MARGNAQPFPARTLASSGQTSHPGPRTVSPHGQTIPEPRSHDFRTVSLSDSPCLCLAPPSILKTIGAVSESPPSRGLSSFWQSCERCACKPVTSCFAPAQAGSQLRLFDNPVACHDGTRMPHSQARIRHWAARTRHCRARMPYSRARAICFGLSHRASSQPSMLHSQSRMKHSCAPRNCPPAGRLADDESVIPSQLAENKTPASTRGGAPPTTRAGPPRGQPLPCSQRMGYFVAAALWW